MQDHRVSCAVLSYRVTPAREYYLFEAMGIFNGSELAVHHWSDFSVLKPLATPAR